MARFYVALTTDDYRALVALAAEERRPMADQAAVLIMRALRRSKGTRQTQPPRRQPTKEVSHANAIE